MSDTVFYLGPSGTFTHQAAQLLSEREGADAQLVPMRDVRAVVEAVTDAGNGARGVIPIENSVHGEVTTTMDLLVFETPHIYIQSEIVVPVSFTAFRRAGTQSADEVLSHPHALAQCSRYIEQLNIPVRETASTAEACRIAAESETANLIALAAPSAGGQYGLQILQDEVEDFRGASTRFFAVGRSLAEPTGRDKTTLVIIPPDSRTGILVSMLQEFSDRSTNLFSIHSRPLKSSLGKYCFILTIDGHVGNPDVRASIETLLLHGHTLKLLGSYRGWSGESPRAPFRSLTGYMTTVDDLDALVREQEQP
jgi:prephenate dehydratase